MACNIDDRRAVTAELKELLKKRVLLLDGSMGVMIQRIGLTEADFRGERFQSHPVSLKGNNDILNLTRPDDIASIHRRYLEAGADIIETNTFNSIALSQKEYATQDLVREINLAGASIAKREADIFTAETGRRRFVAGSIGPTGLSASLSADINDPSARNVEFVVMRDAFEQQAGALIDGGVDIILVETIFDALNAKAAALGIQKAIEERGIEIPIIFSITVSDTSGRILSGHTPEAFLSIVNHFKPLAVGLNCSAGPQSLSGYLRNVASISPYATIFYPNAGLPDESGRYSETPERFVSAVRPLLVGRQINIVGGCCGTTPEHIAALAKEIESGCQPREIGDSQSPWLAGLDAFSDSRGFINIGERCNVAGSKKFLRLIKEQKYDEAVAIAAKQVDDGAMIIDINLDDGLLDSPAEMKHLLRLMAANPKVASLPWMIDSSDFEVIRTALSNIPGRAVVNSISLKNGETQFLEQAREIKKFGAAVVVMAFDEQGQADSYQRKIEICSRAYGLLTEKVGFEPRDIIFDPNVLTIATGIKEHDRYAIDFIEAVRWINDNLPGAKTSGGISNLSFAFRGNNYLRQAMHAVFLYHAIQAGLSMAIMDPAAKVTYEAIPQELLDLLEDVILCRRPDAADRLLENAASYLSEAQSVSAAGEKERDADVDKRLTSALITGDDTWLEQDLSEAVAKHSTADAVVKGPLMSAMEHVGSLFESGKMFLPQVVKSARIMHKAVEILRPLLEQGRSEGSSNGLFLLATVKGDVHDIGKNIAAVVLRCNNFEVIDLGVQVEASAILDAVRKYNPDFIGLSGLISPSLDEMTRVAATLREANITVPLFVGGAATSELHTALHIAPAYGDGVVVRVSDASQNPVAAFRLISDYDEESARVKRSQHYLRQSRQQKEISKSDIVKPSIDWSNERITEPTFTGSRTIDNIPVRTVIPLINWIYFYNCWKVKPDTKAADELRSDAEKILNEMVSSNAVMDCRVGFYPAYSEDEHIIVEGIEIKTPRQSPSHHRTQHFSLADFVAPRGYGDYIGCFVVTVGSKLREMLKDPEGTADSYRHILLQSLCDRLTEAASEWLHYKVRTELWGYSPDEEYDIKRLQRGMYTGIRPAIGYPSLPDQLQMHKLAKIIKPEEIGVSVTENGALTPSSTVAGFYISSPHSRYFTI